MTTSNISSKLKEFTVQAARPLPVIILADVSGSMAQDGKIDALNGALHEMLQSFADVVGSPAEIHVSLITFGGQAKVHAPLAPAAQVKWSAATANGNTPLGAALDLARGIVEDRALIPSRAYTPYLVLASDGQPNDEWRGPLASLLSSERGRKAQRLALAIGDDADEAVLREFLANPEERIFRAQDAATISRFFRALTMSIVSKSRTPGANTASPSQAVQVAATNSGASLDFDE